MGTDKVVIVVKDGMVREVFGSCPYKFDVEVLDMDFIGVQPPCRSRHSLSLWTPPTAHSSASTQLYAGSIR